MVLRVESKALNPIYIEETPKRVSSIITDGFEFNLINNT
jgi:hypothetical protein